MPDTFDRLGFARSRLVRQARDRDDLAVPSIDEGDPGILFFAQDRVILRTDGTPTTLLGSPELRRVSERPLDLFLGHLEDGRPAFAVALGDDAAAAYPEPEFRTADLRGLAAEGAVAAEELGLLATAKSVLAWHARSGFCANCGAATMIRAGGFRRDCPRCEAQHYPRTDPVVIMLVRRGESCLLGRGPRFPGTMYSCLAGFVEPGETIEDAVRRETAEETGIVVGSVRYHASQPWPFPSSLMIGCVAEAESETITIDPIELTDARWVDRRDLALMFEDRHPEGITVPMPMAIAHLLLRDFLDGRL